MAGTQVGLRDLHYAILLKDDVTGVSYGTPVLISGAIDAKISPKSSSDTLYADDGPAETVSTLGQIDVELQTKDLPLAVQAALLGHTVANGVMVRSSADTAPYVAIGFRSKKSNGKYRYIWLYKGNFAEPDQEYKTLEDKPTFQTPTIKGVFIKRDYDSAWQAVGDEEEPGFTLGPTWFDQVQNFGVDTVPPTIASVTPIDGATGVATSASVSWVFSEPVDSGSVSESTFLLIKDSDGSAVAGTVSQSADGKTVTFTPSANLSASTAYRAIVTTGVVDLAGNHLAAATVTKFTTA